MSPRLTRLPILVLEPHSRCNCRCVMCDIWKRTDALEIGENLIDDGVLLIEFV